MRAADIGRPDGSSTVPAIRCAAICTPAANQAQATPRMNTIRNFVLPAFIEIHVPSRFCPWRKSASVFVNVLMVMRVAVRVVVLGFGFVPVTVAPARMFGHSHHQATMLHALEPDQAIGKLLHLR